MVGTLAAGPPSLLDHSVDNEIVQVFVNRIPLRFAECSASAPRLLLQRLLERSNRLELELHSRCAFVNRE